MQHKTDEDPPSCIGESYQTAVDALLSPLHQASTPPAIRAAAARRRNTLRDMDAYLRRLGLNLNLNDGVAANGARHPAVVPQLVIHVTGTKGKGSTLSLCESILRNGYGLRTGTFTSPHLVSMRERIRIDGVPISREVFGRVYWSVRRRLESFRNDGDDDAEGELPPLPLFPGYFRMLALMALYAFRHYRNPRIDAILLEVGVGGRYDATNVFEPSFRSTSPPSSSPSRLLVRGVTLIDYDHTRVLGSTLAQIAWEKGGIFVRDKLDNVGADDGGYDAFLKNYAFAAKVGKQNGGDRGEGSSSEEQTPSIVFANGNNTPDVLGVLQHIADANGCRLQVVRDSCVESFPEIGLQGAHQRSNAALALSMCRYAMERIPQLRDRSTSISQEKIRGALAKAFWPGRCHTVSLPCPPSRRDRDDATVKLSMNLRCDGAHTPISIDACVDWFRDVSARDAAPYTQANVEIRRVLVFNCGHERNPLPLLYSLHRSNLFDAAYLCRADFERPSAVPKRLEDGWAKEILSNRRFDCGEGLTLEGMCIELATSGRPKNDDGEEVQLDPTKMSSPSWQDTLANVWRVFDLHRRHCGGERTPTQPTMKVTAGLSVKDALTAIQKESTSMIDNDVGVGAAVKEKRVLIEVLVTGSLYIVGSALEAAGWEEGEASGYICSENSC